MGLEKGNALHVGDVLSDPLGEEAEDCSLKVVVLLVGDVRNVVWYGRGDVGCEKYLIFGDPGVGDPINVTECLSFGDEGCEDMPNDS